MMKKQLTDLRKTIKKPKIEQIYSLMVDRVVCQVKKVIFYYI